MSPSREHYEAEVAGLEKTAVLLRERGLDDEAIARSLVAARNDLKRRYRRDIDPALLALIEQRNLQKYGNVVGPDADALFAKYGSWQEVCKAAWRHADLKSARSGFKFSRPRSKL